MSVYVKNGTPLHGQPLCESCSNAHLARGYRETESLVVCRATSPEHQVRFRVRECSSYAEKQKQTLWQMEKIAWILEERAGRRVGKAAGRTRNHPGSARIADGKPKQDGFASACHEHEAQQMVLPAAILPNGGSAWV